MNDKSRQPFWKEEVRNIFHELDQAVAKPVQEPIAFFRSRIHRLMALAKQSRQSDDEETADSYICACIPDIGGALLAESPYDLVITSQIVGLLEGTDDKLSEGIEEDPNMGRWLMLLMHPASGRIEEVVKRVLTIIVNDKSLISELQSIESDDSTVLIAKLEECIRGPSMFLQLVYENFETAVMPIILVRLSVELESKGILTEEQVQGMRLHI